MNLQLAFMFALAKYVRAKGSPQRLRREHNPDQMSSFSASAVHHVEHVRGGKSRHLIDVVNEASDGTSTLTCDQLFITHGDGRYFAEIDKNTGVGTNIGSFGLSNAIQSIAIHQDHTIYALANHFLSFNMPAKLATVDPDTGVATEIGPGFEENIFCIEIDSDGTIYGVGWDRNLYRIDPDTGLLIRPPVGNTGIPYMRDLAFDSTGTLYGIGNDRNDIFTIDTSTGESALIGSVDWTIRAFLTGIMFDSADNLYATSYPDNWLYNKTQLYDIDMSTTPFQFTAIGTSTEFRMAFGGDFVPCPPAQTAITAPIDIEFCSNPNGFKCKGKGVTPMTVFGTPNDLDVQAIDPATFMLCLADDENVCLDASSVRDFNYEDRGSPEDVGASQCAKKQRYLHQDGILDLEIDWEKLDVIDTLLGGCGGLCRKEAGPSFIFKAKMDDNVEVKSNPRGDPGIDQLFIVNGAPKCP